MTIEWCGNIQVVTLHACEECATLTEATPNEYGNAYCTKHKDNLGDVAA